MHNTRDLAMISVLVGCGLRRAELYTLTVEDLQIRQGHWAIVDLVGKCGHVVPFSRRVSGRGHIDEIECPEISQRPIRACSRD
ncbi:tyrosine-type recombinase/integrase [Silvibacterium bohemicum]|uniref:tyrosine-type recombinase/integrase n=1 Tax=Silvibacterium bohemicum TaxID=1577686 RepID=UPI0021A8C8ED|nr:tyrosine-type recombinase/integrase [Silvibacterium bohemicum]